MAFYSSMSYLFFYFSSSWYFVQRISISFPDYFQLASRIVVIFKGCLTYICTQYIWHMLWLKCQNVRSARFAIALIYFCDAHPYCIEQIKESNHVVLLKNTYTLLFWQYFVGHWCTEQRARDLKFIFKSYQRYCLYQMTIHEKESCMHAS